MASANAQETVIARIESIRESLARLQAQADGFFDIDADKVNWADAGDLGHIQSELEKIEEFIS